jgi:thioredoxin reductase (NADPH)
MTEPGSNDDASDPYLREAQTFPALTSEMVERVSRFGARQHLRQGEKLFASGERGVDFFVVLSGSVEIYDLDEQGRERVVHVHGADEFTGELDLFNDRRILVNGRAREASEVLRVKRADFRRMVTVEVDIGEILMRAFILRRVGLIRHAQGAVALVGSESSAEMLRLKSFLTRNGYPFQLLDIEADADAEGFLECFELTREQLPVVVLAGKELLRRPSNAQLADALGLAEGLDSNALYDVVVIGAGPGGLAAAVYAASEGLSTLVLEALAPGGQAGTSSKIENYLGFPTGISGQALAGRAQVQAQKFGARLAISRAVTGLECHTRPYRVLLEDGGSVRARTIVVASGARYRTLEVPNYTRYESRGIHYAATAMEGQLCRERELVVVGGGNSAGQAAVFLSRVGSHVYMLVRGPGLAATMSDYLVQRIQASPHITLLTETEIAALEGEPALEHVVWRQRGSDATTRRPITNVFAMLGAVPNTDWLRGCLQLDAHGFVLTGAAVGAEGPHAARSPFATSIPGVHAVGDVRAGSVKRVASAVGEGSVVVQAIHEFLAEEPS